MNQSSKIFSDFPSPEQKLNILRAEIMTPLTIIQGCAALIKKRFEIENAEFGDLMDCINGITKSADKIKELVDELAQLK